MANHLHSTQRNWGTRIRELEYQDLDLIVLENELLRIGVLPGKGTDIIEINYKPLDLDFSWIAPGGVRNPNSHPATAGDATAPFLDNYPGGWQEIFPFGGAPSEVAGARFGQHGEVYASPWDVTIEEDTESSIAVTFSIRTRKMPFLIRKTIRMNAGHPSFTIDEHLTNESQVELPVMWGHHITFGQPFLRPGNDIRFPDGLVTIPHPEPVAPDGERRIQPTDFRWPHAHTPDGETLDLSVIPDRQTPSDMLYITEFPEKRAWYEIHDSERGAGCRVEWDRDVMPYLWYWQEFGAHTEYPWYGRAYVVGLEPFSSMPTNGSADAVENGTALLVEGGQTIDFNLTYEILASN